MKDSPDKKNKRGPSVKAHLTEGVYAEDGVAHVTVPGDVAQRFEAAKQHAHIVSDHEGPRAIDEKHMSGFEQLPDRVRNITEVAKAEAKSAGAATTRTPDVGFPARPYVE